MPKAKVAKQVPHRLSELLTPTARLFCEDVAQGSDGSMYLARLIDQIGTAAVPVVVPRLILLIEFMKGEHVTNSDLSGIKFKLTLTRPDEKEEEIGTVPLLFDSSRTFELHRLVLQLHGISIRAYGTHLFRIYGQRDSEQCLFAERRLPVVSVPVPGSTEETVA